MALTRDFTLWLYRDRTGLSWADLERQPRWRTEWDLTYIGLEALARAYFAQKEQDAHKDQQFDAFRARARQNMGLVK